METFHPNENTLEIVDHINGLKDDNRLENLRWTSYTTNNRNTPYIRYLQDLLKNNKIYYIGEQDWK